MNLARKLWQRGRDVLPIAGFHFDRPLVLLQSDDWGRVGLRDQEGLEQLQSAGLALGARPYDLYTLETTEDLTALSGVLNQHCDSSGRHPCVGMNFILANLDFVKMKADGFQKIHLVQLAEGLPEGWERPGLINAYREGIAAGTFYPAMHGCTHFCRRAVERHMAGDGAGTNLLRTLWQAGTPYIYWRMPWIGFEYWDQEMERDERFLSAESQRELIGEAVGAFTSLFSTLPRSACAPAYRANDDTHRAWAQHGIQVAQNGPGAPVPPHFDRHGILQLSRTIEFEPATDKRFSVDACLQRAESFFERGIPAIIAVHSINFHSTVRDFRSATLRYLDQFLTALESKHPDLLYLHDGDMHELVNKGLYSVPNGAMRLTVEKKTCIKAFLTRGRNT